MATRGRAKFRHDLLGMACVCPDKTGRRRVGLRALLLALWTGQRQGDLLRLCWTNYDGTHIRLRQSKGQKRVTIPVGTPLKLALDAAKAELKGPDAKAITILVNSR